LRFPTQNIHFDAKGAGTTTPSAELCITLVALARIIPLSKTSRKPLGPDEGSSFMLDNFFFGAHKKLRCDPIADHCLLKFSRADLLPLKKYMTRDNSLQTSGWPLKYPEDLKL
jgi:hypothetical protein